MMKWLVGIVLVVGGALCAFLIYVNAGTVNLGGKCSLSSDCIEGSCENVAGSSASHDLTSRCVLPCQGGKCPPGFTCRSVVEKRGAAEKSHAYCF